ncbi:MAG: AbiV family abortive infection protein [Longimicrobiales bacterium]
MEIEKLAPRLEQLLHARSAEEIRAAIDAVLEALPEDQKQEAAEKAIRKRAPEHFLRHLDVLAELLNSSKPLVAGATLPDRYAQFLELVRHVERLWQDAVTLYRAGSFSSATFFALVVLEETGKVGAARFQLFGPIKIDMPAPSKRKRGHPFYSHTKKHLSPGCNRARPCSIS